MTVYNASQDRKQTATGRRNVEACQRLGSGTTSLEMIPWMVFYHTGKAET